MKINVFLNYNNIFSFISNSMEAYKPYLDYLLNGGVC